MCLLRTTSGVGWVRSNGLEVCQRSAEIIQHRDGPKNVDKTGRLHSLWSVPPTHEKQKGDAG